MIYRKFRKEDGSAIVKSFIDESSAKKFSDPDLSPVSLDYKAPLTNVEISKKAQYEMVDELNWCDLQVKLHQSGDDRAVAKIEEIYAHARDCRNYVRNLDGVLTVVGDKPSRPE